MLKNRILQRVAFFILPGILFVMFPCLSAQTGLILAKNIWVVTGDNWDIEDSTGKSDFRVDTSLIVPQLSFRNADLRDIFDALAKTYNLNIWIDEKVQGKTTLHLVNVSLNSVFEFLAEQNQLLYEKSDNIIMVL